MERLPAVRRADKLRPLMPPPASESNAQPAAEPRRLAGFWALIAVQFQGAFSDNALKWLVSFLVLETALTKDVLSGRFDPKRKNSWDPGALSRTSWEQQASRRSFRSTEVHA